MKFPADWNIEITVDPSLINVAKTYELCIWMLIPAVWTVDPNKDSIRYQYD